ncbi:MAG TPA: thioredoxin [Gammaproteobacteria bacterium]|nr:thioredoxin [Gammaproteobacteria bacterium]
MIFLVAALLSACGGSLDSSSVKVGDTAPSVRTKTLQDVGGDFSRITTYRYPDERMYQISLDQALAQKKKILLEFATPGHCTVCDKQLQMLKALINKYGSDVVFLHMDQYENPEAFSAFRVKGDPWTFLIDENGKVLYRQPGRVLYGELDSWLAKLVGDGVS